MPKKPPEEHENAKGHTDNAPIHTARFPSNLHLSTDRAINTAMYLVEKHQNSNSRMSIVGYGEFRPLVINDTPENMKKNRRVDLAILSDSAADMEPKVISTRPEVKKEETLEMVQPVAEEFPMEDPIYILPEHKANPLLNPRPSDRAIT